MTAPHPSPPQRDDVEALNNRGNLLRGLRQLDDALACYDGALALVPDDIRALFNRGCVLLELGRPQNALADFGRVVELAPADAEAFTMRGNALADLHRLQDALTSYERALDLDPDCLPALFASGYALQALDRATEALARYDRALAIGPDHAATLSHRGNLQLQLRRFEDALASYDRALLVEPDSPGVLLNRGNVLLELGRQEDALASYDRALALDPDFADALNNRAGVLHQTRRYEEASRSFERLLELAPEYDYALGNLADCRLRSCDWHDLAQLSRNIDSGVARGAKVVTPYVFLATSRTAAAQLQCARTYATDKFPTSPVLMWKGQRYQHDRIRIAYLSADFRHHVMAYLMVGVLEAHDHRRFETLAISVGPDDRDPVRERLRAAFDDFVDVRANSDFDVAQLLRAREIDIAIDLMGYTTYCRPGILAHRAAPIQVNYLGFCATMGVPHIDYILADRTVIPEDDRSEYVEHVVCLPDTYYPSDARPLPAGHSLSRTAAGLPDRGFVFCSFNNDWKITPQVFDVWMRLLHRVNGSVLWLLGGNASVQANLRREASARGVSSERLIFASWAPHGEYLARLSLADLFLDTLPYKRPYNGKRRTAGRIARPHLHGQCARRSCRDEPPLRNRYA
jgi:predicted O-linked N-acetylglucosamine transferase (SPINDLY family)